MSPRPGIHHRSGGSLGCGQRYMMGTFDTVLGCTTGSTRALINGSFASPSIELSHISFGPIGLWRVPFSGSPTPFADSQNSSGLRRSAQLRMVCPQQNADEKIRRMDVIRACEVLDGDKRLVWRGMACVIVEQKGAR